MSASITFTSMSGMNTLTLSDHNRQQAAHRNSIAHEAHLAWFCSKGHLYHNRLFLRDFCAVNYVRRKHLKHSSEAMRGGGGALTEKDLVTNLLEVLKKRLKMDSLRRIITCCETRANG
jgi:hypothetical protein